MICPGLIEMTPVGGVWRVTPKGVWHLLRATKEQRQRGWTLRPHFTPRTILVDQACR